MFMYMNIIVGKVHTILKVRMNSLTKQTCRLHQVMCKWLSRQNPLKCHETNNIKTRFGYVNNDHRAFKRMYLCTSYFVYKYSHTRRVNKCVAFGGVECAMCQEKNEWPLLILFLHINVCIHCIPFTIISMNWYPKRVKYLSVSCHSVKVGGVFKITLKTFHKYNSKIWRLLNYTKSEVIWNQS